MNDIALGLFALAYSGLVLFTVASSLRRLYPPVRSAVLAFVLSVTVHGATTLMMGDAATLAFFFWAVPHALILPLLLFSARRQARSTGA